MQQLFQNIVDREIVRIQKFYEFLHILKQIRFEISKICTIVKITNIFEKFVVLKSINWFAFTCLQKSFFEICFDDEFSFILKKMSCNLSKINVIVVNFNDIETIDEILVSEFDKWIVVATKKNFDYINIFDEILKNSFAFDIECNDANRNRINDLQWFKSKTKNRLLDIDAQILKNKFRYIRRTM